MTMDVGMTLARVKVAIEGIARALNHLNHFLEHFHVDCPCANHHE